MAGEEDEEPEEAGGGGEAGDKPGVLQVFHRRCDRKLSRCPSECKILIVCECVTVFIIMDVISWFTSEQSSFCQCVILKRYLELCKEMRIFSTSCVDVRVTFLCA